MTKNRALKRAARALVAQTGRTFAHAREFVERPRELSYDPRTTPDHWAVFDLGRAPQTGESAQVDVRASGHLMVMGETGTGKTAAMQALAAQALAKGWEIGICDPYIVGWAAWSSRRRPTGEAGVDTGALRLHPTDAFHPGIVEHACDPYGIRDVLKRAVDVVRHRQAQLATAGVKAWTELTPSDADVEPIRTMLVIIDTAGVLFYEQPGGGHFALINEVNRESRAHLATLLADGPAAGVHLMLGFDVPEMALLTGDLSSHIGARVLLGRTDRFTQGVVFGTTGVTGRHLVTHDAQGRSIPLRAYVQPAAGTTPAPVHMHGVNDDAHAVLECISRARPVWSEFVAGLTDVGEDGTPLPTPVTFNVNTESPHILVVGGAGTARDDVIADIAEQALERDWELFTYAPGVTMSAGSRPRSLMRPGAVHETRTLDELVSMLRRCNEERTRRQQVMAAHAASVGDRAAGSRWTRLPQSVRQDAGIGPWMVVINNALTLFDMECGDTSEIKDRNEVRGEALGLMQKLIVEARNVGIHVMLGIDRPDAAILGGAMRSNLGVRIACGSMDRMSASMVFATTTPPASARLEGDRGHVRASYGGPILECVLGPAWRTTTRGV